MKKYTKIWIGSMFLSLISINFSCQDISPRIAYVNNSKLMIGFSEAATAERELKAENEKWQKQLQSLQDTLKSAMDKMSKEYDNASPARKKELQDMLSASNQRVNNFKQASITKMEKLRTENEF